MALVCDECLSHNVASVWRYVAALRFIGGCNVADTAGMGRVWSDKNTHQKVVADRLSRQLLGDCGTLGGLGVEILCPNLGASLHFFRVSGVVGGRLLNQPETRLMPQQTSNSRIPLELRLAAVGRVTASIVHDANNALAATVWNLDRSAHASAPGSKEAETARMGVASAMKAAGLLQRLLEYSGHREYDPSLVNLSETLTRLFTKPTATLDGDVTIDCQVGSVGPAMIDEATLELGLLDLVAKLSRGMAKNGAITLRAANLAPGDTPPAAVPNARILLSISCAGLIDPPVLGDTLLQHVATLAGGSVTLTATSGGRGEVRLYLPEAVSSSGDGKVFT